MRQDLIAIFAHETTFRLIPSNGGYSSTSLIKDVNNVPSEIGTDNLVTGQNFKWGIGQPTGSPAKQSGSWAFSILPFLEQSQAYQSMRTDVSLPTLACVERGRTLIGKTINDGVGTYYSAGLSWTKTDFVGNGFVIQPGPKAIRISSISDGLSSTLLIGEKSYDRKTQVSSSWYWDEPVFSGGSQGTVRTGRFLLADGIDNHQENQWGVAHGSAAVFGICDGSTIVISPDIDYDVFYRLLFPADGLSGN